MCIMRGGSPPFFFLRRRRRQPRHFQSRHGWFWNKTKKKIVWEERRRLERGGREGFAPYVFLGKRGEESGI